MPIPIVYTDYGTSPVRESQYDANRQDQNRTQVVSGTLRTALAPDLTAELTVGQVQQERLEPDVVTNLPTVGYSSRRNQAVGHVAWQPSARGSLRMGLDASEETARNPDLAGANQLSGEGRHLAVVVDGEREVLPDLRLVGSLRTERDRVTVPTSGSGTVEDASTQVTGKAGVNWTLPRGFRVYANAGTGFSNPLLYQSLFNANYGRRDPGQREEPHRPGRPDLDLRTLAERPRADPHPLPGPGLLRPQRRRAHPPSGAAGTPGCTATAPRSASSRRSSSSPTRPRSGEPAGSTATRRPGT